MLLYIVDRRSLAFTPPIYDVGVTYGDVGDRLLCVSTGHDSGHCAALSDGLACKLFNHAKGMVCRYTYFATCDAIMWCATIRICSLL